MLSGNLLTWIVFLTFNLPILGFLVAVPFGQRLDEALQEKTPTGDNAGVTSYARVTAALGAVILTAFFWGLGNILLAYALVPNRIALLDPLLRGLWPFFLGGSALFLPYAFNQLKSLLPWPAKASTALAEIAARQTIPASYGADEVTRITIANISTQIGDAELQKVLGAIAIQISQHFAPEWKHAAILVAARPNLDDGKASVDGATEAMIYLGDRSSDPKTGAAAAKGYHDRNIAGDAYGFVYLDICKLYGEPWSVTLSHEVLELLADPTAVMTVEDAGASGRAGAHYALEVCDPTQGDHYPIGDVLVCNFVTRAFFAVPGPSARLNQMGLPQTPFTPRPNGYIQFSDQTGPQQIWGDDVTDNQKQARARLGVYRRNGRRLERALPDGPDAPIAGGIG